MREGVAAKLRFARPREHDDHVREASGEGRVADPGGAQLRRVDGGEDEQAPQAASLPPARVAHLQNTQCTRHSQKSAHLQWGVQGLCEPW